MAHNVESMFSVRETPWHGLGKIVSEAPSVEDAIKLAGLDWEVLERQVYLLAPEQNPERVRNYKALVRSDNGNVLSVMKDTYTPLQNDHAFEFFNPFVSSGLASLETAGSLREGKVVWILATLNKAPIEVGKGDEVSKYLLLSNSHDGSMAVRVGFTPVRVVCNNTLTMSHDSSKSKLIRVRHSKSVRENLDEVQAIVNAMDAKFEATAEQYKSLSKKSINAKDLENFVNIVFDCKYGSDREKSRSKKMQESITALFENGAGQHLKSAKGTAWGLYNAATEYLTHLGNKDSEKRLDQNWFGSASRKNEMAFEYLMETV